MTFTNVSCFVPGGVGGPQRSALSLFSLSGLKSLVGAGGKPAPPAAAAKDGAEGGADGSGAAPVPGAMRQVGSCG